MSNFCFKYKVLEISKLFSHSNLRIIELSRIFHQVTQLLRNTTKIVLFLNFWKVPEHFGNVY